MRRSQLFTVSNNVVKSLKEFVSNPPENAECSETWQRSWRSIQYSERLGEQESHLLAERSLSTKFSRSYMDKVFLKQTFVYFAQAWDQETRKWRSR